MFVFVDFDILTSVINVSVEHILQLTNQYCWNRGKMRPLNSGKRQNVNVTELAQGPYLGIRVRFRLFKLGLSWSLV